MGQDWNFEDVTAESGMDFSTDGTYVWSGVSVGDFDGDGWEDLFICRDGGEPQRLFRNKGDGTFEEIGASAGLANLGEAIVSSLFFDYNGDGWLDMLFASGFGPDNRAMLFRNRGDGTFEDVEGAANLVPTRRVCSLAAGDYDVDGDIDLYMAINDENAGASQLWRNNGDETFTDVGAQAGILPFENGDLEFSPSFSDINNDGWPDLLIVGDFNTSQIYINNGDGTFRNTRDPEVITDEGGMGSAIGDYDNDGDLDWFVSSIWDDDQNPFKPWGVSSGNRLYRNKGDGSFEDATDDAGVRIGYWGWGSTFGDFNNDGHLDIFHTNGFGHLAGPFFATDPARLFVANGDHSFTERSAELNLVDNGLGHGIAMFDYDHDGDLDLFIANSVGPPRLFRNNLDNGNLSVFVEPLGLVNKEGLGAKVYLHLEGGATQMREIRSGSNFLSENPCLAHFGMGGASEAVVEILWLGGTRTKLFGVKAGERIKMPQLPYSYDDSSVSFYRYYAATKGTLNDLVAEGRLTEKERVRVLTSALKAFLLERYPSAN